MKRAVIFLLVLHGCASFQNRSVESLQLPWRLSANDLPEPIALTGWRATANETPEAIPPSALKPKEIPVHCGDHQLYPANPQPNSRRFHIHRQANFDFRKLSKNSLLCKIRNKENACLMADTFEYAVISDLYEDGCGNLYRALWNVHFRKQSERPESLLSKGKTFLKNQSSSLEDQTEAGDTQPSAPSEFLFVTAPFPSDLKLLGHLRHQSGKTHKYDSSTHLFHRLAGSKGK